MISPHDKSFDRIEHDLPSAEREQQRLKSLTELGLLDTESIPVFEEATQTAAHFLDAPICILGVIDRDRHWFKSAVGLSRIGLMNELAISRQLPRSESFCSRVLERRRSLMIADTTLDPELKNGLLVQTYGIHAYLGVPLFDRKGNCLGTLSIMELVPRSFSSKDVAFLELMARWCMGEFDQRRSIESVPHALIDRHLPSVSLDALSLPVAEAAIATPPVSRNDALFVKSELITQMTQELRTPLTSVLGMTSLLKREIYGPLTEKQKEYMDVVHNSGQYLLSVVNEILELGGLDASKQSLDLSPVDIEMLCQQAISSLSQAAQRREQELRLTVEPGPRIWLLDKGKIRQMMYHLAFSLIEASNPGSIIRIHVSRKQNHLHLMLWTSHPWFGDGLPQTQLNSSFDDLDSEHLLTVSAVPGSVSHRADTFGDEAGSLNDGGSWEPKEAIESLTAEPLTSVEQSTAIAKSAMQEPATHDRDRQELGIRLSRQLAKMHGGEVAIQGAAETGYHYVVVLPHLTRGSAES